MTRSDGERLASVELGGHRAAEYGARRDGGSEVQRPLATVVVGGVLSSSLLTLVVLPVLYTLIGGPRASSAPRSAGRGSAAPAG